MAPSNDPLCPSCPDEALIDISDPAQRESTLELEADALDRHTYKWMAGLGVTLGVLGVAGGWLTGVGELFYITTAIGITGGVGLGRVAARRLWTRGGRAAGLDEAIARHQPGSGNTGDSP